MRRMQVRIVPMSYSDPEFIGKDLEYVQRQFFCYTLPFEELGWYYYKNTGLIASEGDLLLFQIDNQIIASAILVDVRPYPAPDDNGRCGAYHVKNSSIRIFDPISSDELRQYIPQFKSFSEVKYAFNIGDVNMSELDDRMNVYTYNKL